MIVTPLWKAALGLTGPKAEVTQQQRARAPTKYEKVRRLEDYLIDEELLVTGWTFENLMEAKKNCFARETILANRIIMPRKQGFDVPGLAMWLSMPDTQSPRGFLCLLEDYRKDDDVPTPYLRTSSYTVLNALMSIAAESLDSLLIGDYVDTSVNISLAGQIGIGAFVKDPIRTLETYGCLVAPPRQVQALYRVREYGDEYPKHSKISVFGYPVYVSAAD